MDVILVCVVHDPDARNMNFLTQAASTLRSVYAAMYIAVSDETHQEVLALLGRSGFSTRVVPKTGAANARRDALRFASTTSFGYFHYCDLDRILTWALHYPDELPKIQDDIIEYDYTIFGRTARAFHTHPESWVKTEAITNHICSMEIGFEVDITAGSCGFSRNSLDLILHHSVSKTTDAEWAMIVRRIGKGSVGYRAVEGLEYREDINGSSDSSGRSGSAHASADSWFGRLRLSYLISESAMATGKDN